MESERIGYEQALLDHRFYQRDRSKWREAACVDLRSGKEYQLCNSGNEDDDSNVVAMTYGGILENYRFHPEPKFAGPNGEPCGRNTRGLLPRRYIKVGKKHPIRKESNRRWE